MLQKRPVPFLLTKKGHLFPPDQNRRRRKTPAGILINPEAEGIVKKLNKVNLSPDKDNNFNLFNKFTMPLVEWNAAAFVSFGQRGDRLHARNASLFY
jgi:hypothetical protein